MQTITMEPPSDLYSDIICDVPSDILTYGPANKDKEKLSADDILKYLSQKKGFDISCNLSNADNLHEMSDPIFWEK